MKEGNRNGSSMAVVSALFGLKQMRQTLSSSIALLTKIGSPLTFSVVGRARRG